MNVLGSLASEDLPSYYQDMFFYSGFIPNSLGNYEGCNKIEQAKYVTLYFSGEPPIFMAYCGPKACTEKDYYEDLIPLLPNAGPAAYLVVFPKEYQEQHYSSYTTGAKCMIAFIACITALSCLASITDYFIGGEEKNYFLLNFLLCFSVIANGKRLLRNRAQERLGKEDSLEVLNAVRVMSIGWVILGHTFLISAIAAANNNWKTVFTMFEQPEYILVYGGFFAVDAFFWVSGLLMTYLFLLEVNKSSTFSAGKLALVYIHRYLRITPVYMFVLLFFWALQEYLGSGPLWIGLQEVFQDCKTHWYTNMVYINNFVPDWKSSDCLGVGWYLANDMQYFIISPIIILVYVKLSRTIGWILVGGLCSISIITSGVVANHFDLNPSTLAESNGENYFDYYYNKPYTRIAPYAFGIACGFILYTYRRFQDSNEVYDRISLFIARLQETRGIRILIFGLGLGLINVLIFSQYDIYKHPGPEYKFDYWTKAGNYTFIALERAVWGLGLSMVFLPLILGHFQPIISFMSMHLWSILARFTFVMYLIHFYVIITVVKSQETVSMVYGYTIIRDTIYFFILSLFFAIPIVLLIEMPAANLERLIFARRSLLQEEKPLASSGVELVFVKGNKL